MEDVAKFLGMMMALVTCGVLGYAGVTAVGVMRRRALRGHESEGLNPDEVEMLRANLAETDHLRARVAELEERLDFAERLLGQGTQQHHLGEGR